jgi:uncharacterized membrane protein
MQKSNAKNVAFYGVMSGLMFVFLLIETYVFSAFFGNFTPAILTLPLAVSLSLFNGKKGFWVGGTIFGCCSFFLAICISNVIFLNPLVSILPRIFIGVLAFLLPMANKENLKTDDKGDKMMPIIGIMLFICAIFSCLMSYMAK